jgi:hypothetical protein
MTALLGSALHMGRESADREPCVSGALGDQLIAEELFRELAEEVGLALPVSRLRLVVFDFGGAVTSTGGRGCTELPACRVRRRLKARPR